MRDNNQTPFGTEQLTFGQPSIADIKLDIHSRDQIPQLLLGIQNMQNNKDILDQVYKILDSEINSRRKVSSQKGRTGMSLWNILVAGLLKLNNKWDYDHLENMVNSHREIRLMMGYGPLDDGVAFKRRTLINNLSYISAKGWQKISALTVKTGHQFLEVTGEELKTRADSFVVEKNVHFPTDIGLLMDAIRKIFALILLLEGYCGYNIFPSGPKKQQKISSLFNKIRKLRRSCSKSEQVKKKRDDLIQGQYFQFLELGWKTMDQIQNIFDYCGDELLKDPIAPYHVTNLSALLDFALHQIHLTVDRIFLDKKIPQNQKVYSLFEYYTEWISKGKAKAPVELGHRVAIMEDQFGFILHSQVMHQTIEEQLQSLLSPEEISRTQITDEKITISFLEEALEKFPNISSCSFDKGFYSPQNQKKGAMLPIDIILPKKGKLSKSDQDRQSTEAFIEARKRHSGIESCIHALENHALDVCRDKGMDAFHRYVACAVAARNLQVLGSHIQKAKRASLRLSEAA